MQNSLIKQVFSVFLVMLAFTVSIGILVHAEFEGTEQLGILTQKDGDQYYVVAQNYKKDDGSHYSEIWLQQNRWQSTTGDKKVMEIHGVLGPRKKEAVMLEASQVVKEKRDHYTWPEIKTMIEQGIQIVTEQALSKVAGISSSGPVVGVILLPREWLEFDAFNGKRTGKHESM